MHKASPSGPPASSAQRPAGQTHQAAARTPALSAASSQGSAASTPSARTIAAAMALAQPVGMEVLPLSAGGTLGNEPPADAPADAPPDAPTDAIQAQILQRDHEYGAAQIRKSIATSQFDKVRKMHRLKNTSHSPLAGSSAPAFTPTTPSVWFAKIPRTPAAQPAAKPAAAPAARSSPARSTPKPAKPPIDRQEQQQQGKEQRSSNATSANVTKEPYCQAYLRYKAKAALLEAELHNLQETSSRNREYDQSQIQTMQEIIDSKQLRIQALETLGPGQATASWTVSRPNMSSAPNAPKDSGASLASMLAVIEQQSSEIASLKAQLAQQQQSLSSKQPKRHSTAVQTDASTAGHHQSTSSTRRKLDRLLLLLTELTDMLQTSLEGIVPFQGQRHVSDGLPDSEADRISYITSSFARLRDAADTLTSHCQQLATERKRLQRDYEAAAIAAEEMRSQVRASQALLKQHEFALQEIVADIERKQQAAEHVTVWLRNREGQVEAELARLDRLVSAAQAEAAACGVPGAIKAEPVAVQQPVSVDGSCQSAGSGSGSLYASGSTASRAQSQHLDEQRQQHDQQQHDQQHLYEQRQQPSDLLSSRWDQLLHTIDHQRSQREAVRQSVSSNLRSLDRLQERLRGMKA
ncbi:hypothetical protein BC831DRAFT_35796 [Entophlyctis helioformis]|nr:hypothetical protein BC831DRAFT_35796 [Entophlyctis helioformis]